MCLANKVLITLLFSGVVWQSIDAAEYADNAALCRALEGKIPERPILQDALAPPDTQLMYLDADQLTILQVPNFLKDGLQTPDHNQVYQFSGNVHLQRNQQVIKAEHLRYSKSDGEVEANGEVTLWDDTLVARSPAVTLHEDRSGTAKEAHYWLIERRGHGQAAQVMRHNAEHIELQDADYTTCPGERPAWQLRSRNTQLDLDTEEGVARDVTLYLGQMPVFYTPYLSFPITDKRKSGFLPPKFGYSSERGAEISVPYYWNLAPNYDATFAPMLMTNRGLRLDMEARYLTARSQGVWAWDFLPDDSKSEEDQRFQLKIEHLTQFNPRTQASVLYNEVSDNQYFTDFSNTLSTSSTTHLERRLGLSYLGDGYLLQAFLQNYQTLSEDPAARPYARLPQITLQSLIPEQNGHWHWSAAAEYTDFQRDLTPAAASLLSNPTGQRLHTELSLELPWQQSWGFFRPKLAGYFTQYRLSGTDSTQDDSRSRALYSLSADSGLFMERSLNHGGFLQTLEPRLFYLYVPYQAQQMIPLFDSAEYDFSFAQMFRNNRFVGHDRIGDENRVALALTSRFLASHSGEEYFRASLGQSFHFADRRVSIDNQTDANSSSDVIGELAARIAKNLTASQTLEWDAEENTLVRSSTRLRYQNSQNGQIFNAAYRVRKNLRQDLEQTDFSWFLPINQHWSAVGRWNYSLEHNKNLETFAGFEYNSCCWAVRVVGRRYLQNLEGDYSTGAFLQLELKGLAGFGRGTGRFLSEAIGGFAENLDNY